MKLAQNQVWKQGDEYLRIVILNRRQVQYKKIRNLMNREGEHHQVSKKEFCRMLKSARLLSLAEVREISLKAAPIMPPDPGHE